MAWSIALARFTSFNYIVLFSPSFFLFLVPSLFTTPEKKDHLSSPPTLCLYILLNDIVQTGVKPSLWMSCNFILPLFSVLFRFSVLWYSVMFSLAFTRFFYSSSFSHSVLFCCSFYLVFLLYPLKKKRLVLVNGENPYLLNHKQTLIHPNSSTALFLFLMKWFIIGHGGWCPELSRVTTHAREWVKRVTECECKKRERCK